MGRKDGVWVIAGVSIVLTSLPTLFILYYGFVVFHNSLGFSRIVLESIGLTIFSSGVAAILIFIVFTPLAYELSRQRHTVWEAISDIPASIPHPIVGIAFLLVGSPLTPLGRFLSSIGFGLFNTIQGLIIALSFIAMPIYVRSAQSIFASRHPDPENFAFTLGASRLTVLYSILVRGSYREIVSSALTAMSRAMSEFGSVAIIAYYVLQYPFNGAQTASVLIYQYYGYYGPSVAISASAFMILFSLAIIIAIKLIGGTPKDSRKIRETPSQGGGGPE